MVFCKKHLSVKFLVGLGLTLFAAFVYLHGPTQFNPVAYDDIVNRFFQQDSGDRGRSFKVDVWSLWQALGIKPRSVRESGRLEWRNLWPALRGQAVKVYMPGRYLFGVQPGGAAYVDCDFVAGQRWKIISLSRDLSCTQVLVFKRAESEGVRPWRFAYAFTTGLDRMSDRARVWLVEPEPGLVFLELSYRDGTGTGISSMGRSLYRLTEGSEQRLLRCRTDGWSIGPTGGYGHGFRCEIGPWTETWPKLEMRLFSEYVPWSGSKGDDPEDERVDVYELNTRITLIWDHERGEFVPWADSVLSMRSIRSLMDDQIDFLMTAAEEESDRGSLPYPVTKVRTKRSEVLSGWGR